MPDSTPTQPPTLLVAIDGLRAAALGAYGQTSYETPAFDALATEAVTHDEAYAPTPEPSDLYASLLAAGAFQGGTLLVSDDPAVAEQLGPAFDRVEQATVNEPLAAAQSIAETTAAETWSAFAEALVTATAEHDPDRSLLAVLHTRGLYGPWDAPVELSEPLRDEDDPELEPTVAPPDRCPNEEEAPEARFAATCRYAAQVMATDACLAGWLDVVEGLFEGEDYRLIIVGLRGFPLGEHGRVGGVDPRLFSEQQHVPLLVCDTRLDRRFTRQATPATLDALLASLLSAADDPTGPVMMSSANGDRAVIADEWMLRSPLNDPEGAELYVKPDDRWEQNDIASREQEAAESLLALLSSDEGEASESGVAAPAPDV